MLSRTLSRPSGARTGYDRAYKPHGHSGLPDEGPRPVIVLAPNLSQNSTGRAIELADLISPFVPVVIAGRSSGPRWEPMAYRTDLRIVDFGNSRRHPTSQLRTLAESAVAIIAVKPLFSSFLIALGARTGLPVALDIDDPEVALATAGIGEFWRSSLSLDGPLTAHLAAALRYRAQVITIASRVLAREYGGLVVPHVRRGVETVNPASRDRSLARLALGLDTGAKYVLFVGTPRPHKGLDLLNGAARYLPDARIVIVGATRGSVNWAPNVSIVPPVRYEHGLQWLASADVVVVPQRSGRIGRLQTPAKLSDALSVGRAIVASDLPPIREVVGDAAVLVPPDNAAAVATAIDDLLHNIEVRVDLEARARARFLSEYSTEALAPVAQELLRRLGLRV